MYSLLGRCALFVLLGTARHQLMLSADKDGVSVGVVHCADLYSPLSVASASPAGRQHFVCCWCGCDAACGVRCLGTGSSKAQVDLQFEYFFAWCQSSLSHCLTKCGNRLKPPGREGIPEVLAWTLSVTFHTCRLCCTLVTAPGALPVHPVQAECVTTCNPSPLPLSGVHFWQASLAVRPCVSHCWHS